MVRCAEMVYWNDKGELKVNAPLDDGWTQTCEWWLSRRIGDCWDSGKNGSSGVQQSHRGSYQWMARLEQDCTHWQPFKSQGEWLRYNGVDWSPRNKQHLLSDVSFSPNEEYRFRVPHSVAWMNKEVKEIDLIAQLTPLGWTCIGQIGPSNFKSHFA